MHLPQALATLKELLPPRKQSVLTDDLSLYMFAQKWLAIGLRVTLISWRGRCRRPPKSVWPGS
jgi:hypothetical protein